MKLISEVTFNDIAPVIVEAADGKKKEHYHQHLRSGSWQRSGALSLALVDLSGHVLGALLLDGAAEGDAGAKDLLDGAFEGDGHRLLGLSHGLSDLENVVKLEVTVVGEVLLLLSVSAGLLQGLNNQS